jgi:hypothetical protein
VKLGIAGSKPVRAATKTLPKPADTHGPSLNRVMRLLASIGILKDQQPGLQNNRKNYGNHQLTLALRWIVPRRERAATILRNVHRAIAPKAKLLNQLRSVISDMDQHDLRRFAPYGRSIAVSNALFGANFTRRQDTLD